METQSQLEEILGPEKAKQFQALKSEWTARREKFRFAANALLRTVEKTNDAELSSALTDLIKATESLLDIILGS